MTQRVRQVQQFAASARQAKRREATRSGDAIIGRPKAASS
jgi:hypothetical protein